MKLRNYVKMKLQNSRCSALAMWLLPLLLRSSCAYRVICRTSTRLSTTVLLRRSLYRSSFLRSTNSGSNKNDPSSTLDTTVRNTGAKDSTSVESAQTQSHVTNREQFSLALQQYLAREKYRRGHVSFITNAMNKMPEFGLERDLITYNRLLDILPKGRFYPKRLLDVLWPRPLPQTELALELLTRMEDNRVWPDQVTYSILLEVFGKHSLPVEKCERILYWFDLYKDADPYWIEGDLPEDQIDLSKLTLQRIVGKDGSVREHEVFSESQEPNFLLSGTTDAQMKLLKTVNTAFSSSPSSRIDTSPSHYSPSTSTSSSSSCSFLLYVEGPHRIWINKCPMHYFSLRLSVDDSKKLLQGEEEGLVLGVCMCRPPTQDSLQQWLKALQLSYPSLGNATVIYNISQGPSNKSTMIGDGKVVVGALETKS